MLFLLRILDEDLTACIAPFYISYERNSDVLKFIGTGNTDYMNIIIHPGFEKPTVKKLKSFLLKNNSWDEIYLDGIYDRKIINELNCKLLLRKDEPYPALKFPGTFTDYVHALNQKFKKNILRNLNFLEQNGDLIFETANENNLEEYLTQLFKLHQQR